MRIVHFSTTRLAGAPIRLVQALRKHTEHDVRLVDLERWGQFEQDIVFGESVEEVVELCREADVIHLHNYLDYDSTAFRPVDFGALRDRGVRFVRHFHSTPETVAGRMGQRVEQVLACPIPSLVVAGLQERYYPRARVVRVVVPQDDPLYRPSDIRDGIVFSPSVPTGAWADRWNTKGAPETAAMLERVRRRTGCAIHVVQARPLADVMAVKQRSFAVVDDLVTGSYHTSALEGLCVGRPTLCFVDERIRFVLAAVSGTPDCPLVNVALERAEEALVALVREPERAAEVGRASRSWIEDHWADRILATEYAAVYEQLPEVLRQPELAVDPAVTVALDRAWESRRRDALRARPLTAKALERAARLYRGSLPLDLRVALRRVMRRALPSVPRVR